jgi:hypothetical protein
MRRRSFSFNLVEYTSVVEDTLFISAMGLSIYLIANLNRMRSAD